MDGGNPGGEAWPAPVPRARARQRLPDLDDLPSADEGYDRESVRAAFDSFYRHIAQLDSTLRALESVEVFRDQAGELRREVRALRAAGWAQQHWPARAPGRVSPGAPEWLPRVGIEAAFLISVAVVVAVAPFDRLSIVLVMALAWAIVGVVEWAASRERFAGTPAAAPATRVEPAVDEARTLVRPAARELDAAPAEPEADVEVGKREPRVEPPRERRRMPAFANVAAVASRTRRVGRRRIGVVALVTIALPGGIAAASVVVDGRDRPPPTTRAPVARETPRPRAVGPEAIGPPKRAVVDAETTVVVRASRGDSWVEVRANSPQGEELYAGLLAHGRVVRTRAQRLWLRLGAASNVDVLVNGRQTRQFFGTVAVVLTPRGVVRG